MNIIWEFPKTRLDVENVYMEQLVKSFKLLNNVKYLKILLNALNVNKDISWNNQTSVDQFKE